MRLQVSHSPQKSSLRRSQLAACANMRARVNLPRPRGPLKSSAWGTRSLRRCAAESGDDSFIAEKFGEAHGLAAFLRAGLQQNLQDRGEDFRGDFRLRAHGAAGLIETSESWPSWGGGRADRTWRRLLRDGGGWLPEYPA